MRMLAITFGGLLVLSLFVLIFIYFSPKRKQKVEQPKYDILKDDDD